MRQVYSIARQRLRSRQLPAFLIWKPHHQASVTVSSWQQPQLLVRCFSAPTTQQHRPTPGEASTTTETTEPTSPHITLIDPAILPHVRRCNADTDADSEWDRLHRKDSMFHLYFMGTGGAISGKRMPSCTALRLGSETFVFDVGEGAQRHLHASTIKLSKISRIFITHLHGDHVMGLPSLLLNLNTVHIGEDHGSASIQVYGPPGIHNYITTSLALTHSTLRMTIEVYELVGGQARLHWKDRGITGTFPQFRHGSVLRKSIKCGDDGVWEIKPFDKVTMETNSRKRNDFRISAAEIHHIPYVQTFGFVVEEKAPPPKIDIDRAREAGVEPGDKYTQLKHGFPVMNDAGTREVQPEEVLFEHSNKGRKLALLADLCGIPGPMVRLCRGADVLIHEAALREQDRALSPSRGHSTASMAGHFANLSKASLLILNHIRGALDAESQEPSRDAEKVIRGATRVITAFDFMEVVVPREGFQFTPTRGPVSQGSGLTDTVPEAQEVQEKAPWWKSLLK